MKNNLFLKISALILVLLLLVPVAAGCQKKPPQEPSPESTEASKEPKPNLPRFDGETVNFYVTGAGMQSRSIDIGEDDDPTHMVNVAVKKRNERVEKELGVDIVLKEIPPMSGTFDLLWTYLAGNVYKYDVAALYQYFDLGLAFTETEDGTKPFYNLYDLPEGKSYLNLEASYWDRTYLEGLSYKDVGYFITGDLSLGYTGTTFVSYVNTDMWARYADDIAKLQHSGGYDDPYDIVKNGYWTIDLWMELADLCYKDNGDKVKDYKDQAGFMTYDEQLNNIMVDMLMAGSKVHYGSINADGTPSIDILSDKNIAFYNKLYNLLCNTNAVTMPWVGGEDGEDGTYILDLFADGKVLLNVNTLAQAEEYLSDMKDEYLVMPLPMFDHSQFDKNSPSLGYATQTGDSVSQYAIPTAIGDEKLPAVTATLELMAYYSEKWVTPTYYEAILGADYARDPRVPEMLDLIQNGRYTDFVFVWSHSLWDVTWQLRQHYSEGHKIESNLLNWDRNVTSRLNTKLLAQLEKAFAEK